MAGNSQIESQILTQTQVQTLSPQQVLEVRILQLPTVELEQKVRDELYDNPALEDVPETDQFQTEPESHETDDQYGEDSEGADELAPEIPVTDDASADFSSEDDMPDYYRDPRENRSAERQAAEIPYSDSVSLGDLLSQQLGEQDLDGHQMLIGEYIIGSLNDDGLLNMDLQSLSDELAIHEYIEVSTSEIEQVLKVIQGFDPAGIAARDLRECLLLQLERLEQDNVTALASRIVSDCLDDVMKKRRDRVAAKLQLSDTEIDEAYRMVEKLNPSPGSSLGEIQGHGSQYIVPDFIVSTDDNGEIEFWLNNFNVPELRVNPEYERMLAEQKASKNSLMREAAAFTSQKLEAAKGYIQAIKQREKTLTRTMSTIISMQQKYFLSGDESQLQPMILKDIAERTGLDISTISRATNGKYAQTDFGIIHLKDLFTESVVSDDGQEVSVREIHRIIREAVKAEDRKHPLTDDQLASALKAQGYNVARRTVAKYREQLQIPIARLRK